MIFKNLWNRCFLHIERRSQPRWFRHLVGIPLGCLTQDTLGETTSRLSWECLVVPAEELVEVAMERRVWVSLPVAPANRTCISGRKQRNKWTDVYLIDCNSLQMARIQNIFFKQSEMYYSSSTLAWSFPCMMKIYLQCLFSQFHFVGLSKKSIRLDSSWTTDWRCRMAKLGSTEQKMCQLSFSFFWDLWL